MSKFLLVYAIKEKMEVETKLHALLSFTIDEDEWSDSRSGRFTPGEINTYSYLLEDQMVSEDSLDNFETRKISTLSRNGTVDGSAHDLVSHIM